MRLVLVSSFLAEIIQQIHSLRASGVMSSHPACILEDEVISFLKSAGSLCATPLETLVIIMSNVVNHILPL
jgi:hypothetical protein